MIEFYVSGQNLKFFTPVIAADSLNYLTAKVNFADGQWEGYSKWLHFRQDEDLGADTYDLQLNDDNEITAEQKLNLTIGQWEIYLTGTKETSRLTTVPVILTVKESGLIDAPLHELPLSVAEQVDYNAQQALLLARTVKDMADAGEFDGKDGTSLAPIGHFSTPEELAAIITDPAPGDVYSVGEEAPYDLYVWDGINLVWRNHGQLQGAQGERGEKGVTFIPSVSAAGNISWTNDSGLANPATRNIMGPKGADGNTGPAGPGAFEKAQEAGYTGTEETFYAALTMMPYHNKRHLPDGADPITVKKGNLADGAVSRSKLDKDVKNITFVDILIPDYAWVDDDTYPSLYPFSATIMFEGSDVDENYEPNVTFAPNTSDLCPSADSLNSGLKVYAAYPPEEIIKIQTVKFTPVDPKAVEHEVFATISVTYAAGKTCNCTDGVRISTAKTKSGRWTFAIPYAGTWLISDGENEQSVSITTQGQSVNVVLDVWDGYLYKNGDEYESVTGGWSAFNPIDGTSSAITNADGKMTLIVGSGVNVAAAPEKPIKVDDITKIAINVANYSFAGTGYHTLALLAKRDIAVSIADYVTSVDITTTGVATMDVSNLSGEYYVAVLLGSNAGATCTLAFTEMLTE